MNTQAFVTDERGNVLFLILLAVALFAALSFAIVGSNRYTDNDSGDSSDQILAAQIVQYPSMIRTAIIRMQFSGVAIEDMEFNNPANYGSLTNDEYGVFHPEGGGATYVLSAANVMERGAQGRWYFNAEFEIENIGLSVAGDYGGNELIAFLPGIKHGVCARVNERLGIGSTIPNSSADLSSAYTSYKDDGYTLPATEAVIGMSASNGTDILTGRYSGCFRNNGGEYVYYHAIIEK